MQSAGYAIDIAAIDHSRASDANPGAGQHRRNRTRGNRSSCPSGSQIDNSPRNGSPAMPRLARVTTGSSMTNSRNRWSDLRIRRLCAIGAAALSICSVTTGASASGPCEREMTRAAQRHGVPLGVLYAVGLSETGRKGVLNPYALNIDGKTALASDLRNAVALFPDAKSKGRQAGRPRLHADQPSISRRQVFQRRGDV